MASSTELPAPDVGVSVCVWEVCTSTSLLHPCSTSLHACWFGCRGLQMSGLPLWLSAERCAC